MIVHLVRHGQSYNTHRAPDEPYPANPPLTPIGVQQAERVAMRMAALGIDRLLTSPMLRSVETASKIAATTGLNIEVLVPCYEHRKQNGYMCFGSREILERYPDLIVGEDFGPDEWLYGEETIERAMERADQVVSWVRAQATASRWRQIAVVTHGAITRVILAHLLGVAPAALDPIVFDNTSLTTLRVKPEGVAIAAINDSAHLGGLGEGDPAAGVTR